MALGKLFNLSTPAFLSAFLSIIIPLARAVMDGAAAMEHGAGLLPSVMSLVQVFDLERNRQEVELCVSLWPGGGRALDLLQPLILSP